jgi:hypothetical protein
MLLGEQSALGKSQNLLEAIAHADEVFKFNGTKTFDVSNFEKDAKCIRLAREAFCKELQRAFRGCSESFCKGFN